MLIRQLIEIHEGYRFNFVIKTRSSGGFIDQDGYAWNNPGHRFELEFIT